MSVKNIKTVLAQADEIDLTEGKLAYQRYNELLKSIASYHNVGFVQTVAAFVSLSPNNDYIGNLRSLVTVIEGIKTNKSLDNINCTTYKHCRDRAYQYLIGEKDFLVETKGPKVKAFYHNILKPEDKTYVTIDGHMYSVWIGKRLTMKESVGLGWDSGYDKIAKDFKLVARQTKLIPCQLQAVLWMTWKRINNVKFNSQNNLFDVTDHWQLIRNPENIKPL